MYNELQKNVLCLLLDQYENSKTYTGDNKVNQSFDILPTRVFEQYDSDYIDVNLVFDFENQIDALEERGLIQVKRDGTKIAKLIAVPEKWNIYYEILQRLDKYTRQNKQLNLYQAYLGIDDLLDKVCLEQIDKIEHNKKATYGTVDAIHILRLCQFILTSRKEMLEREISITVLGESKLWEKKYRTRVCALLRRYGDFNERLSGLNDKEDMEDKRQMERIILAEYQIFSNPSYVYFRGDAEFLFEKGKKIEITLNTPIAFSTETLMRLQSVIIRDERVMTVENLTSFNRLKERGTFFIFLSGYHNSVKQKLIRKIEGMNSGLKWFHFGDIDPDGFYIIAHLKRGTGIEFEPIFMGVSFLEKYKSYTRDLTDNDIRKAKGLIKNGKYCAVMEHMLKTGQKLEQEIISWMVSENI